jgi:hypothetical protein
VKKVWKEDMSLEDVGQIIQRFLQGRCLYPQEWNDFVDTPQIQAEVESYRKRCYELDPLVNRPGNPDPHALAELESIVASIGKLSGPSALPETGKGML